MLNVMMQEGDVIVLEVTLQEGAEEGVGLGGYLLPVVVVVGGNTSS